MFVLRYSVVDSWKRERENNLQTKRLKRRWNILSRFILRLLIDVVTTYQLPWFDYPDHRLLLIRIYIYIYVYCHRLCRWIIAGNFLWRDRSHRVVQLTNHDIIRSVHQIIRKCISFFNKFLTYFFHFLDCYSSPPFNQPRSSIVVEEEIFR